MLLAAYTLRLEAALGKWLFSSIIIAILWAALFAFGRIRWNRWFVATLLTLGVLVPNAVLLGLSLQEGLEDGDTLRRAWGLEGFSDTTLLVAMHVDVGMYLLTSFLGLLAAFVVTALIGSLVNVSQYLMLRSGKESDL